MKTELSSTTGCFSVTLSVPWLETVSFVLLHWQAGSSPKAECHPVHLLRGLLSLTDPRTDSGWRKATLSWYLEGVGVCLNTAPPVLKSKSQTKLHWSNFLSQDMLGQSGLELYLSSIVKLKWLILPLLDTEQHFRAWGAFLTWRRVLHSSSWHSHLHLVRATVWSCSASILLFQPNGSHHPSSGQCSSLRHLSYPLASSSDLRACLSPPQLPGAKI